YLPNWSPSSSFTFCKHLHFWGERIHLYKLTQQMGDLSNKSDLFILPIIRVAILAYKSDIFLFSNYFKRIIYKSVFAKDKFSKVKSFHTLALPQTEYHDYTEYFLAVRWKNKFFAPL